MRIILPMLSGLMVALQAHAATAPEERPLPWVAKGRVTDIKGKPLPGAVIRAHCGIGSLFLTGETASDTNGGYLLRFGPGVLSSTRGLVQAATLSVHLDGWFETNLHRQGDLIAAMEMPTNPIRWSGKTTNNLFLPGKEQRLDFVLAPAAVIKGIVTDENGKPLANQRVGITGTNLPPSSSVLAETRTSADGRFEFKNVPTGYSFQLYTEPPVPSGRERSHQEIRLPSARTYDYSLQSRP